MDCDDNYSDKIIFRNSPFGEFGSHPWPLLSCFDNQTFSNNVCIGDKGSPVLLPAIPAL